MIPIDEVIMWCLIVITALTPFVLLVSLMMTGAFELYKGESEESIKERRRKEKVFDDNQKRLLLMELRLRSESRSLGLSGPLFPKDSSLFSSGTAFDEVTVVHRPVFTTKRPHRDYSEENDFAPRFDRPISQAVFSSSSPD